MTAYAGIVSHEPADQVIVVRAGTLLAELREELAKYRLCIPMPDPSEDGLLLAGFPGTVGGLVSMNLPHGLYGQCGGPRDWVLGMAVVRGDGTIAKSGSRVVKSVAGYDVHKMFIGARGTLGVVAEVALQTYPVRAVPPMSARNMKPYAAGAPLWIQRVLPSDFDAAVSIAGAELLIQDSASATIWAYVKPEAKLRRFPDDWVIRADCGAENRPALGPEACRLMQAAKTAFDPQGKFNAGAMGCV
jgi:FAD/FMN-containing dehydrogenase